MQHKPDRFDMYSAGVVMMQLALPSLRTNSGLITFNRSLKRCGYDLFLWRDLNRGQLSRSKTAVLDAGDGAGWALARELLRPRSYDEDAWAAAQVSAERTAQSSKEFVQRRRRRRRRRPVRAFDGRERRAAVRGGGDAAQVLLRGPGGGGRSGRVADQVGEVQREARDGRHLRSLWRRIERVSGRDADAGSNRTIWTPRTSYSRRGTCCPTCWGSRSGSASSRTSSRSRARRSCAPGKRARRKRRLRRQRTLEKMNIGLQSLLRAFSFSQVEAKTTMIKAATEIQTELDDAGVKDDKPDALRGFMRNIFGKKASEGGVAGRGRRPRRRPRASSNPSEQTARTRTRTDRPPARPRRRCSPSP